MILAVDSTTAALIVNPASTPPTDPSTGQPVSNAAERVEHLVSSLGPSDTLIIPTPVLSEVLVKAGDAAAAIVDFVSSLARVRLVSFDTRAAIEAAAMTQEAIAAGDKRSGSQKSWQAVKLDRQIIATARVARATRLYTDDGELAAFARLLGMDAVSTWELPLPPHESNLFTSVGLAAGGFGGGSSDTRRRIASALPTVSSTRLPTSSLLLTRAPRAVNLDDKNAEPQSD